GTSTTLKQLTSGYFTDVTLLAANTEFFLFALEVTNDSSNIVYARFAADGTVEVPITSLTSAAGNNTGLVVAPANDGFGILWGARLDNKSDLDFATMRFDGTFENPPGLVVSSSDWTEPAALVATNRGFLASYAQSGMTGGGNYVLAIAPDGAVGAATALSTTDWYSVNGRHSLLWRGTEALLAWSRMEGTSDDERLGSTIMLTRLGADAQRLADDLRVSAWVRSQDNRDPKLFARGNDVGLTWSQGSVIYICAGCMPDNHLEFVIFDGTSFAPKSALRKMTNPATAGGLISPTIAQQGNDIITASVVGYHTSSELAAGTFTCTGR
ncbi:MAG TPA: hypothetical protein VIV60_14530, partial [Polyangiaceae bacterium]